MTTIAGTVKSIRYRNEDNFFTIFSLRMDSGRIMTVKGTYLNIQEKEYFTIHGKSEHNQKYGDQFVTDYYEACLPQDLSRLKDYLSSGMVAGIRGKRAEKIISKFKEDTLDILMNHTERLAEIDGIGKGSVKKIKDSLTNRTEEQSVLLKMYQFGIPQGIGHKIYTVYKENAMHKIQTEPYDLIEKIPGVSFRTADNIALKCGMPKTAQERLRNGILFVLDSHKTAGCVCYPEKRVISEAKALLECEVDDAVRTLINSGMLVRAYKKGQDVLYRREDYRKEEACASMIKRLTREIPNAGAESVIQGLDTNLDDVQINAVKVASSSGLMILTGGPGVGKTTTTNMIIRYFEAVGKSVLLASPTGRAAKRLSEATGRQASTIHRMLVTNEDGGFEYNADNPLEADVIIIDEVSMLDMYLMYHLLLAVRDDAQLILVGDKNQLPSVGAGNVLGDMIASGICPVVELTKIYRQADGSDIVKNAHNILNGNPLTFSNTDFFFKSCETEEELKATLAHYVADTLPDFTGEKNIQVLTPLRKRACGSTEINRYLQEKLNPMPDDNDDYEVKGFRLGDKVIQTKNNYGMEKSDGRIKETGVFNGDTGKIEVIDFDRECIIVHFDDGWYALYKFDELSQLELAYAITIHKSQGSEYPVVVIPVWDYVPIVTTMNQIYTGVTRAKKTIVLLGSRKRLVQMIKNVQKDNRYTGLEETLRKSTA